MGEKTKLCHINTDKFKVNIKIEVVYLGISKNVKTKFDTSNYYLDRPLPKGKNIKVIGSIKLNQVEK